MGLRKIFFQYSIQNLGKIINIVPKAEYIKVIPLVDWKKGFSQSWVEWECRHVIPVLGLYHSRIIWKWVER